MAIIAMNLRWWDTKPVKSVHLTILQFTPAIICWKTWKVRCADGYQDAKIYAKRIQHQIIMHLKWVISKTRSRSTLDSSWNRICGTWFYYCMYNCEMDQDP